ncbi:MAG: single-stranded DNA-binding protein [Actinomycetota bacterium]|nr:single-stranded DNA-binding protein [Actinomycetota bacterium]
MNEARVTVSGNVVTDPRHVETQDGVHITSFRLASTPRRWDRRIRQWVDGDTSYYSVTCWRHLAQNAAASLHKGDPVVVTGDLRVREWTSGERSGTSADIDAVALGHDLSRGMSEFRRVSRTRPVTSEDEEARRLLADVGDDRLAKVDPVTGEIVGPDAHTHAAAPTG